jgi:hypothetical protein
VWGHTLAGGSQSDRGAEHRLRPLQLTTLREPRAQAAGATALLTSQGLTDSKHGDGKVAKSMRFRRPKAAHQIRLAPCWVCLNFLCSQRYGYHQ